MIAEHQMLLADAVRTGAYRQAIREVVREGDVVLDLGTGTGILAFFAYQAGARRVYAIERSEIIQVAQEVCRANGLEDRIVFIRGFSPEVDLPERVDVIVSELLGHFALEENLLPYLVDARRRFLKPGGKMLPSSVELFLAPVEAPQLYQEVEFWSEDLYGIDFRPARDLMVNNPQIGRLDPQACLCPAQSALLIDFYQAEEISLDVTLSFRVERPGWLHGLGGWFEAHLCPGVVLSTAPHAPPTHWAQTLFPIEEPLKLQPGDMIQARLFTSPFWGDILWHWQITVKGKDGQQHRFEHSTFRGIAAFREEVVPPSPEAIPCLPFRARMGLFVLQLCDGKHSLGEIVRALRNNFPETCPTEDRAWEFLTWAICRYGVLLGDQY